MARVLTYIVIPERDITGRHEVEAVSHGDALSKFIANPVTTFGYHKGDWPCTDGEQFVVIGGTQENPNAREAVTLMTARTTAYRVTTRAQEDRDFNVFQDIRTKIDKCGYMGQKVEIKVNRTRQEPIDDLLIGQMEHVDQRGIRINGVLVPWSDIDDVVRTD